MGKTHAPKIPVLTKEGESPRLYLLIKFIDEAHVESFRSGCLRLGSVKSYREKYQGEPGKRHDTAEFLSDHHQPDKIIMEINGQPIVGLAGPVQIRRNLDHCSYMLCMSAITDRFMNQGKGVQKLSTELVRLAPKAVLITNAGEFIHRINQAIEKSDHLCSYPDSGDRYFGLVEYVDFDLHHGQLGAFRKSLEYAFQLEWRVAVVDTEEQADVFPDHIWLEVGDISDITSVTDSSTFLEGEIVISAKEGAQPID